MKYSEIRGGWGFVAFEDHHGNKCSIQECSVADEAIWMGRHSPERMILNRDQIEEIIRILQTFVDTGSLCVPDESEAGQ